MTQEPKMDSTQVGPFVLGMAFGFAAGVGLIFAWSLGMAASMADDAAERSVTREVLDHEARSYELSEYTGRDMPRAG